MNKIANFWIRFFAGFLDVLFFLILSILLTFILFLNSKMDGSKYGYQILDYLRYYSWFLIEIILILVLQIIIPSFLLKGQTLGKWITRIKIIPHNNQNINKKTFLIYIIKKEFFYAFAWIFLMLIFMFFISPRIASKMIGPNFGLRLKNNNELKNAKIIWEDFEKALISIPILIANANVIINLIMIISVAKNKGIGLNDVYSNTRTVWVNKFVEPKKKIELFSEKIDWPTINWINKNNKE